ncbi:hypothetical protein [Demequina sp. NBRC 110054]|uniref:hypothetical protein n=1 Tax=Demequina sp. NBRC 110054 TaxID=1570343 RepID=UPI0009FE01E8|nr:hypothetical protein [Demequina sp. NBRC 110054]
MDDSQGALVDRVGREAQLFKDVGVAVGAAGQRWLETSTRLCADLETFGDAALLDPDVQDADHSGHVRAAAELFERVAALSPRVPQMLAGLSAQADSFRDLLTECVTAVKDGEVDVTLVERAERMRMSFETSYVSMADLLDEVAAVDQALRFQLVRLGLRDSED